jgi:hypothetical protein
MADTPEPTPQPEFFPLYNGMPVVIRLLSGGDVLCTAYRSISPQAPLLIERPLQVAIVVHPPEDDFTDLETEDANFKEPRPTHSTNAYRWMPTSSAMVFPVKPEHILTIAPISDQMTNLYIGWADQLYLTADQPSPSATPQEINDEITEDERNAYFDFLLQSFVPTGKPH